VEHHVLTRRSAAKNTRQFRSERRTHCRHKADAFMHRRGFAFVTGGPGCGKTFFVNELCSSQNSRTTNVMYIPFAMFGDTDMLREICRQIGIEPAYRMGAMIRNIQERIREMQPVNPILVIDEVQLIGQETLDMLRILTNFKFESANLFTVIMAGDESFQHRLRLNLMVNNVDAEPVPAALEIRAHLFDALDEAIAKAGQDDLDDVLFELTAEPGPRIRIRFTPVF